VLARVRFEINFWPHAQAALDALRAFERGRITDAIEVMLSFDPLTVTRNRKPLFGVVADFDFVPPMWQLKVAEHRVFYDVDEVRNIVHVRAIRFKAPGKTTQEILR
jgi:mRNA-degrading endonuclease RelE of RelBE toxin-antitoxin system